MDLLGNNLAKVRKTLEESYNLEVAIQLLVSYAGKSNNFDEKYYAFFSII